MRRWCARITGAWRWRSARRLKSDLKTRNAARHCGDLVAGTWHRHGSDRSGGADRIAALGGQRNAAYGPRQPSSRGGQHGGDFPQISRAICWHAPRSRGRCMKEKLSRCAIRAMRWMFWRSRSSPWSRWTRGDVDRSLFAMVRSRRAISPSSRGTVFESVLDMLSGRYPSEEFAELRPRITWDRVTNRLRRGRAPSASPS